jgi:cobalamin biosynthesis Mg chelatase CobN
MKTKHLAAGLAAAVLLLLSARPAAAADLSGGARSFMRGAESAAEEILPDATAAPDATLGDTSGEAGGSAVPGDGQIEGTAPDIPADPAPDGGDGFPENGSDTLRETEEATETAQTSSGTEESGMSSMVWIAVVILLAGTAAILVFALTPRKR